MSKKKITIEECLMFETLILPELEQVYIKQFPIWRLVRNSFRRIVIGAVSKTSAPNIIVTQILKYIAVSFWGVLKTILSHRKYSNVFFPHSRLFLVNNIFMERFSDSLIDCSGIEEDYIIFERPQNGKHSKPRYHKDKVVYLDFIEALTRLLLPIGKRWVEWKYNSQINKLCKILDSQFKEFHVADYKGTFSAIVAERLLQYNFTKILLRSVQPKRIFLAHRETFNHVILYAKKKGITTVELQHGIITVGETVLYSGKYNPQIDPDYFFVFGASNIGNQFSIPIDRIKNVGYPYKKYISTIGFEKVSDNCLLVISDPQISVIIVDTLILLAKEYPQYEFHIRCHPQEKLTKETLKNISLYANIKVVDNTYESFCTLYQYTSILGENSSVLYEAMSLHKKVGRLNFNGLKAIETELIHGGFKINCIEDFYTFMTSPYSDANDSKELYSDFNIEAFNSIL